MVCKRNTALLYEQESAPVRVQSDMHVMFVFVSAVLLGNSSDEPDGADWTLSVELALRTVSARGFLFILVDTQNDYILSLKLNHPSQVTHRNDTASRPNWSGPALGYVIVSIFSHSFTITALESLRMAQWQRHGQHTHARTHTHSYTLIHTQTHTGHSNTHPHIHTYTYCTAADHKQVTLTHSCLR